MIKQALDISNRPTMRLGEIERLIKKHRIIMPPLSRATLIRMCEDNTFEAVGGAATKLGWLVYEDSFLKWLDDLETGNFAKRKGLR